jgi:hypothetical protein
VIVGVHGIAQQQVTRQQLVRDWDPAPTGSLDLKQIEAAAVGEQFGPPGDPDFSLAFYGHLFPTPAGPGRLSSSDGAGLDDLMVDEIDDMVTAAQQVLSDDEIALAERQPPLVGHLNTPLLVQAVLRALDARYGRAAGVLYLGTLRQVRRYLRDPGLKNRVDAIVDASITPHTRILVGHALGSVVALEYVRRHPEHNLDLLVTLGSPLALTSVQTRLPVPFFGTHTGLPPTVNSWVNVRDRRDPVASAGDLGDWWSGVDDRHVDNGAEAHSVHRYLGKPEAHSAIDAVKALGARQVA